MKIKNRICDRCGIITPITLDCVFCGQQGYKPNLNGRKEDTKRRQQNRDYYIRNRIKEILRGRHRKLSTKHPNKNVI